MKYLVTGAAGFLGYYFVKQLANDAKNEIFAVDNYSRGEKDELFEQLLAKPNVHECAVDLTDKEQVQSLPDNIDIVIHMAALNGTQNFYERPFEVVRSCTLPTIHLIEKYGEQDGLKRFVYAGTSEAYALMVNKFDWSVPTAEDVPLGIEEVFNSRWSYAGSKMHGEIATFNGCQFYDKSFTILRYHNAYGPRMGDKHVVPDFLMRARDGRYELFGYEDTRSFIYAEDAVRASLALTHCDDAANQIVNVGSDQEITILDLGTTMMKLMGKDDEIELHPSPKGSVKRRSPDISKLKKMTGYEPVWSLEEGLAETIGYYVQ